MPKDVPTRLPAGLALSLAGHMAVALLLFFATRGEEAPPEEERLLELQLLPDEAPEKETPGEPPRSEEEPEVSAPTEVSPAPRDKQVAGALRGVRAAAAVAVRATEEPPPLDARSQEGGQGEGDKDGSPGEGEDVAHGDNDGGSPGEGGEGVPGGLDPRGLSLRDLDEIADGPVWVPGQPGAGFTGARGAFVMRQIGGATSLPAAEIAADNQAPLATAVEPFAAFIAGMHKRIHKHWAEGALKDFEQIDCGNPVNDRSLSVGLEIVLGPDGALTRAAPVEPSGEVAFDAAAVFAIYDAAPFDAPPKELLSYDDQVYLRWTLHRDERQCGVANTEAFLLTGPAGSGVASAAPPAEAPPEAATEVGTSGSTPKEAPTSKKSLLHTAFTRLFGGCEATVKEVKETALKLIGLKKFCKEETPFAPPEAGSTDERLGISAVKRLPLGPPDELSFPACKPGCGSVCLTF